MEFSASSAYTSSPVYQPCSSAFTFIERPTRWLHECDKHDERHQSHKNEGFLAHYITRGVIKVVVHPLMMCISPMTMVADIIIGVAEISFAAYKGCNKETLLHIAKVKFVASPVQHLTFISVSIISTLATGTLGYLYLCSKVYPVQLLPFAIFQFCLVAGGAVAAIPSYRISQVCVANLPKPKWTSPDGFNIFIDGGASDVNGKKYTNFNFDEAYRNAQQGYNAKQSYNNGGNVNPNAPAVWNDVCEKVIKDLNLVKVKAKNGEALSKYDQFKNGVVNKLSPINLLGLKANFTADDLKRVYKQYAMILHPDRNRERVVESTELAKLFFDAHIRLDNELKS